MNYKQYTLTELNNLSNDLKKEHEEKKAYVLKKLDEVETIEQDINTVLSDIEVIEKIYLDLVEEVKIRQQENG